MSTLRIILVTLHIAFACAAGNTASRLYDIRREAAITVDNPINKRISVNTFKQLFAPQLTSMYGINSMGRLVQIKEYDRKSIEVITRNCDEYTSVAYRVVQCFENGMAIITSNHGYSNPFIGVNLGRAVPDDTVLNLRLLKLDKTYTYTTVLGAPKTIALAVMQPNPEQVTEEQLVGAFIGGRRFLVVYDADYKCPECEGRGTTPYQHGTFTLRTKCLGCNGTRKIKLPTLFCVSVSK